MNINERRIPTQHLRELLPAYEDMLVDNNVPRAKRRKELEAIQEFIAWIELLQSDTGTLRSAPPG